MDVNSLGGLFSRLYEEPEPNVDGSFDCQQCGKRVKKAYSDRTAKTLTWTCEDGHKSLIEDIVL